MKIKINLIYYVENNSVCNIFDDKFVNNNKNNKLVNKYELKKRRKYHHIIN